MNTSVAMLLEYQKIEAEIIKLNRSVEANPSFATKDKMVAVVKEAQTVANDLEVQAKQSIVEFEKLKAYYADNQKKVEKLSKVDIDSLSDDQLAKLNKELEIMLSNLTTIENRLKALNSGIEVIVKRFENAKKNAFVAKGHYQKAKEEIDKLSAAIAPQKIAFGKQLEAIRPKIDAKLFARYATVRKDNIFPAITRLVDGRCGACRMELSRVLIGRLAADDVVECENCRRIVFQG